MTSKKDKPHTPPSDWQEYKLSELMEIIGGGTPKTNNIEYWNGNIPWISVNDIGKENRWIYETEKMITQKGLENSSTRILNIGDIVISARGTVGEVGQLRKPMAFNQSCYGLHANSFLSNDFLYYLLKHGIQFIKKNTHGSVFNTITRDTFENISINIPLCRNEQDGIVTILSSLDNKIDLLQRQNETLEKMAQLLFKHWFVDFEFPNEECKPYKSSGGKMKDTELGPIPASFSISKIGNSVEILGGGTPSTMSRDYWDNGKINWYTPTDITKEKKMFSFRSSKKITESGLKNSSSKIFPKYSILMTSRATVGEITINVEKACTNQGFIILVPNERYPFCFLHGWLYTKINQIKRLASGSTFPEISRSVFKNLDIYDIPRDIMEKYTNLVNAIYMKTENNIRIMESMISTRDGLLPKLMSGQIRIKD